MLWRAFFTSITFLALLALAASVQAATLRLDPAQQGAAVGESFLVIVTLDTPAQAINALEGTLTYPAELLKVKSISTGGTLVGIWVEEPHLVSGQAQVSWSGGVLKPGFQGSGGRIFSVTFTALAAGSGTIRLATGAVLAADGEGTNVLTGLNHTAVSVSGKGQTPAPEVKPSQPKVPILPEPNAPNVTTTGGTVGAPAVISPTHPDSRQWYRNRSFVAEWNLPSETLGVSRVVNGSNSSNPGPKSDGLDRRAEFSDLEDGTHYLHVKFLLTNGESSPITHFPVRVDATPPRDLRVEVAKTESRFKQPVIDLNATDDASGIAYYEVELGVNIRLTLDPTDRRLTLPTAKSGTYAVTARAYDRAGNSAETATTVMADLLEAPVVIDFPHTALLGDAIKINGQAEPQALVEWRFSNENSETDSQRGFVQADERGFWQMNLESVVAPGHYTWRFNQRTVLGVESGETDPYEMEVINFVRVAGVAVPLKTLVIFSLLLLASLVVTIVASLRAFRRLRLKAIRQALDIEERVHAELNDLEKVLMIKLEHLKHLKGERALSKAEAEIEQALKKAMKHLESRNR